MKHEDIPLGYQHPPHNWEYADQTAREAATGFDADDVGKWALQLSPRRYYALTDDSPITWELVGGDLDSLSTAIATTLFATRSAKTGAYTVVAADRGVCFDATSGTWTLTLDPAATLTSGFAFAIFNSGSGVITIDADGTEEIRDQASSATTKTLAQGEGMILQCTGTGWNGLKFAAGGGGGAGTVTNTGGDLTTDAVVLGAGGDDAKAMGSLGTAGQVLTSAGAGTPPTWEDPTGGSGGGTKTILSWCAAENISPTSNAATYNLRNRKPVYEFDDTTSESMVLEGIVPEGSSFSSGAIVRAIVYGKNATSGNVMLTAAIERGNTDIDSDSFATGVDSSSTAISGTSGIGTWVSIPLTSGDVDGAVAGDVIRLKLSRKTSGVSGNMTGDAQVSNVEIQLN